MASSYTAADRRNSQMSPTSSRQKGKGNSPLYRFPKARSLSSSSTDSSASATSTDATSVDGSSSDDGMLDKAQLDRELNALHDIRSTCIGEKYCRCMHCYKNTMGDFVFETQEEFEVYFDALKEAMAAAGGKAPALHCHVDAGTH